MNEQQPQYFDPNATPTAQPAPWWKTWRLAIPVLCATVVVLVVVFVVNTLTAGKTDTTQKEALTRMEQELADCANDRDPVACEERVRGTAGKGGAGESACKGLDGDAYSSCVALSAKSSGSVAACASLSDDEQTACENLAYFTLGQQQADLDVCKKITDVGLRTSCSVRVTQDATAANTCAASHVDEALCVAAAAMRDAIATGDSARCLAFDTEDKRVECSDGITSVDEDGDGLTVAQEFSAGTSDNSADTDGDGYTDKDEIDSGHDPLKP